MKKWLSALLVCLCMLSLAGCEKGQGYFNAEVLQVHSGFVEVRCVEPYNSGISAGEEFSVTTDVVSASGAPKMKTGDTIRVVFNGDVMESDPLQLGTVFAIYLFDENGEIIP